MESPLGSVSRCLLTYECITSTSQLPALVVSWTGDGQPGIHVSWDRPLLSRVPDMPSISTLLGLPFVSWKRRQLYTE